MKIALAGISVIRTPEISYPVCPFCQRPIRRPCQIEWPNDVGILVLCGGCYRLLMTLQRMAEHGLISFTSGFPKENETE